MNRSSSLRGCVLLALASLACAQGREVEPGLRWTAGLTCVVTVADLDRAVGWYVEKLGFAQTMREDKLGFAALRTPCDGVQVGLARGERGRDDSGSLLSFGVFDVAAARAALLVKGVEVSAIEDFGGLVRRVTFRDPDGNALALVEVRPPAASAGELAPVAFLAGSWLDERDGRHLEEHWTAPLGGVMVGMSRGVRGGKAVFIEHLRIEKTADGVEYVAAPDGRTETRFRLDPAQCEPGKATFVNAEHDYPKRITYRILPDGDLGARIDDGKGDGRHDDFRWQRGSLLQ